MAQLYIGVEISNGFFDILKDTFAKGEFGQDVTVNELVEEIKEKLSGIIEQPDSI